MIELELGKFRKARYWDNCPFSVDSREELREEIVLEHTTSGPANRSLAIELMWPAGAHIGYGLLGATYSSRGEDLMKVLVLHTGGLSGHGDRFEEPLVGPPEKVFRGLPKEFSEAVLGGVRDQSILGNSPPGTIVFDCAAHGVSGSSEEIFRLLARSLVQLIAEPEADPSDVLLSNMAMG